MDGNYQLGDIVLDNWKLVRKIGAGSFGTVFEAEQKDAFSGKSYQAAIKIITITPDAGEDMDMQYCHEIVEEMLREIDLMYQLKGDSNIVSYEGHTISPHSDSRGWDIIIRMELLTPLGQYLKEKTITQRDVMQLGIDICMALEVCQKFNIIHRDIKPENIFVSAQGKFKLGDFGIARTMESRYDYMSKKGTYSYMAPEIYCGKPYGPSADIYSLGIVMYRLLNKGRLPLLPDYPKEVTARDKERALGLRMAGQPLPKPAIASERLAEIVLKACAYAPVERYESPWILHTDLSKILYTEHEALYIFPNGDTAEQHSTGSGREKKSVKSIPEAYQLSADQDEATVLEQSTTPDTDVKEKLPDAVDAPEKKMPIKLVLTIAAAIAFIAVILIVVFSIKSKRNNSYIEKVQDAAEVAPADAESALENLAEAIEIAPDRPEAYREYAYILYQNGQYQQCSDYVHQLKSADKETLLIGASADFELRDYANAAQVYYTIAQSNEEDLDVDNLRDYAVCLGRLGRLNEATAIFVMLTNRGASLDVTEYVLGESYYVKQDYENAVRSFSSVLTTSSDTKLLSRCYASLAECYNVMGQFEDMQDTARRGLVQFPGSTILLEFLGKACYQLGDYAQAADSFAKCAAMGMGKPNIYADAVIAYISDENYDAAKDIALKMTLTYPRDYTGYAWASMAEILLQNSKKSDERNYEEAFALYQDACSTAVSSDDQSLLTQLDGLINQLRDGKWLPK